MAKDKESDNKASQAAIDAYLKNGGKVTVFAFGERTDPEQIQNSWGHKKKKVEPKTT
jgi:hypothetical protein